MTLAMGLSLLIGVLLGLLGGGGSILTVPMLVYVLKTDPKTAIVTSLIIVGISSLIALIPHARRHSVCWKSGLMFGLAGTLGAYGGGRLTVFFSSDALMALFGLVTLITGLAMLRPRKTAKPDLEARIGGAVCPLKIPMPKVLFDGFFVGVLTGLVGVGGGFLIVPALTMLVRLPMQAAVGTSLLVIVMNAVAGLMGYAGHVALDLDLTATVTGWSVFGAIIGGVLSTRISTALLRSLFGLCVLSVAGYVLYQSLTYALLLNLKDLFEKHIEFVMGVVSLAAGWGVFRFGQWIHQREDIGMNPRRGDP